MEFLYNPKLVRDSLNTRSQQRRQPELRKPGQRNGPTSRACERSVGWVTRLLVITLMLRLVWSLQGRPGLSEYKGSWIIMFT